MPSGVYPRKKKNEKEGVPIVPVEKAIVGISSSVPENTGLADNIKLDREKLAGDYQADRSDEQSKQSKRSSKKAEAEKEQLSEQEILFIAESATDTLDILCARMPSPAPLSEKERERCAKVITKGLKKYAPNAEEYSFETSLVLFLGGSIVPRFIKPKEQKTEVKVETSKGEPVPGMLPTQ